MINNNNEKNKERLKKIMSAVIGVDISRIDEESSTDNIEEWDSLKHINLIISVEQEFKISLPDEEIASLTSFALLNLAINEALVRI